MSFPKSPPRCGQAKQVVLVALLIVLTSAAGWLWFSPATQPSLDGGRAIAEAFLTELREAHPEKAWDSTTAEFKSAQGREAFQREVKPLTFLQSPLDFVSAQVVEVQAQPRSEYLFRAKTGETVRIVIGKDDGRWKVDRWVR